MTLDINKIASPYYYYMKFIKENCRPDGRNLYETRPFSIDIGSISTANGSSLVRYGSTIVLCTIKAQLAKPRDDRPDRGYLITNVDLPPLCSTLFKSGQSSEKSQMLTQLMFDILNESKCLNDKDLCIQENKLCWVLNIDLICLNYDGNLTDVCCLAMLSALKNTKLYDISYDTNLNKPLFKLPINLIPLKLNNEPICTTLFILNQDILICDPNKQEEEEFSSSTITICTLDNDKFCLLRIFGGHCINKDKINLCFERALHNSNFVRKKLKNYFE